MVYTWVCSTTMHVLFRCGVSRAKTEAAAVLGAPFAGIGVTDDYAAYKSLFTQHQLCWAHLIRKAIKLALQHPDHPEYATFLDALCETSHQTLRHQRDGRLSVGAARRRPSSCSTASAHSTSWRADRSGRDPAARGRLPPLADELMDNPDCLFVFVEHPTVEATNNRRERNAARSRSPRRSPHQQDGRQTATRCDPRGAGLAGHPLPATPTGQLISDNPLVEDRLVHLPAGTRRAPPDPTHRPPSPPKHDNTHQASRGRNTDSYRHMTANVTAP